MAPEEKTPKATVAEGSKPESKSETAAPEQAETTSKTPTIIAGVLVVAAVLLLVGGAYFYRRGESENTPSSSPSSLLVTPQTAPVPAAQSQPAANRPLDETPKPTTTTDQTKATIIDALLARDTAALTPYLADTVTFTRNATSYFAQKSQSEAATSIMETLYDDPSWNFDQSNQLNAQIRSEEQGEASDILVGTSTQNVIILRFNSGKVTSVATALVQQFTAL